MLVAGGAIAIWRRNTVLENTLLHSSQLSLSPDTSNEVRVEAWSKGVKSIIKQPLGQGPGTAGPASFRNNRPRIAENYFIQIAQEVGIIGMAIFMAISVVIAKYLWRLRSQTLPAILLASFIGLNLVNLLSHAWADDTLAYLWWGLAGVASASVQIKKKAKT